MAKAAINKLLAVVPALVFFVFALKAQSDPYLSFDANHYQLSNFKVNRDDYKFNQFTIAVIRVQNMQPENLLFSCRGWVLVQKGKIDVDSLYYAQMDANGGYAGIYIPEKQPLQAYFLLAKFGDYNGQLLVIDSTGKIKTDVGGNFIITPDKKYVYAEYSTDIDMGVSVFNVARNKFEFSCDSTPPVLKWFDIKGRTYGMINPDDAEDEDEAGDGADSDDEKASGLQKVQVLYYDEKLKKILYTFLKQEVLVGEVKRVSFKNFDKGCCCE